MPSLFVIRGNDQGSRFELDDPIVGLGRDSSNRVQLHDTEVSRQHAEVRRAGTGYAIWDLTSSNGTFVNGRRVEEHRLQSGDHVQVGNTLMLYTGAVDEALTDIGDQVDIAAPHESGDRSRIIHSITGDEGSRIFDFEAELPQNSWLARARSNLQVMYRTALAVSHTLDIGQLLQRIMELIFEWVDADRGCIMLVDPETADLKPKVRLTRGGQPIQDKITVSKTIVDYVMGRNEGVLTSDARDDDRWSPAASIVQMGIREAICVPMQGRYGVVGLIYIDTSTAPRDIIGSARPNKFTQEHLKLMVAIAHQAALAVEDTRYYSAMVQAERLAAVGQTIATLSHHIKNILQGIRGGSYLIEMGLADHDEAVVSKGWTIVEKNQNKISALVMDMLTFSKEREPELVPSDLNHVVGDVVELMQARAEELHVQLEWQPDPAIPTLVFDPEGIHRAVLNVLTNALDAAADGQDSGQTALGRVRVWARYDEHESNVRIVVDDSGSGIPADQLDNLFSPFVSYKGGRGTGLGLPVSKKIVTEHGGRILVETEPGCGSRFILELPAVAAGTAEHPKPG